MRAVISWYILVLVKINIGIVGVIRELQTENPGIFGPNGGYSRAYSLTNLSWNIGLLTGPLLSGSLVQAVGYYYMNFTFGMLQEVYPFPCLV